MSVSDEIKQKLDIVDIVSETVKLRKSGRSFSGFCPFHPNTRTPSFYVFPDTQSWHCFGACSTGGDVFSFVMKRENVEFPEALRLLAARAGVPLSRSSPDEDRARQTLLTIVQTAAEHYHYLLKQSPAARGAREYLGHRQVRAETVDAFLLGYAPGDYETIKNVLQARGFSFKDIETAGLILPNASGSGYHDRFRNRLIFPIRDRGGQAIAFGARALDPNDQPKYLNSPDTPLFSKSAVLYGLDQAKEGIRTENLAILVEGYMDALIAHQAGFKNVVASLGTALTEKQLGLLKRLTKRYALALDADAAGEEATKRGLSTARASLDRKAVPVAVRRDLVEYEERLDAELLIIAVPEGKDPDEVILRDPEEWRRLVREAVPLIDYYLRTEVRDLNLATRRGKEEGTRRLAQVIAEVQDPVARDHYAQQAARLLRVDERLMTQRIAGAQPITRRGAKGVASSPPAASRESYFLGVALQAPHLLERVAFVEAADLANVEYRALLDALRTYVAGGPAREEGEFEVDAFCASLDEPLQDTCRRLLDETRRWREQWKRLSEADHALALEVAALHLRRQRLLDESVQLGMLQQETEDEEERSRLTERANQVRVGLAECQRQLQKRTLLSHPLGLPTIGSMFTR